MPWCALLTAVKNYNKSLEKLQDFFFKTWDRDQMFKTRTPRPRLSFLSSRRLETKTLVSRTTSLPYDRYLIISARRNGSVVVWVLDLQSAHCWFDSRPPHCQIATPGKSFTHAQCLWSSQPCGAIDVWVIWFNVTAPMLREKSHIAYGHVCLNSWTRECTVLTTLFSFSLKLVFVLCNFVPFYSLRILFRRVVSDFQNNWLCLMCSFLHLDAVLWSLFLCIDPSPKWPILCRVGR